MWNDVAEEEKMTRLCARTWQRENDVDVAKTLFTLQNANSVDFLAPFISNNTRFLELHY